MTGDIDNNAYIVALKQLEQLENKLPQTMRLGINSQLPPDFPLAQIIRQALADGFALTRARNAHAKGGDLAAILTAMETQQTQETP